MLPGAVGTWLGLRTLSGKAGGWAMYPAYPHGAEELGDIPGTSLCRGSMESLETKWIFQ